MLRTLTFVSILVLLAGAAAGLFAGYSWARRSDQPDPRSVVGVGPALEAKVRDFVEYYRLSPEKAQAVREVLLRYDDGLMALMQRLHEEHREDFRSLSREADDRIREIVAR